MSDTQSTESVALPKIIPPATLTVGKTIYAMRELRPSEEVDLLLMMNPAESMNYRVVQMIKNAAAVTSIDNVPVPLPTNMTQAKALMDRIGSKGLRAIATYLNDKSEAEDEEIEAAKNSSGTLSSVA